LSSLGDAYRLLAKLSGNPQNRAHIGMFAAEECRLVLSRARRLIEEMNG